MLDLKLVVLFSPRLPLFFFKEKKKKKRPVEDGAAGGLLETPQARTTSLKPSRPHFTTLPQMLSLPVS
jgi:hypothetical protein